MSGHTCVLPDTARRAQRPIVDSVVEREHALLVRLIEAVDAVCTHADVTACQKKCSEDRLKACQRTFRILGEQMRDLMLDHFERESAQLDELRRRRDASEHCMLHRSEHVRWSMEFNQRVSCVGPRHTLQGLRKLKSFVADWMRLHAAEFDMRLQEFALGKNSA